MQMSLPSDFDWTRYLELNDDVEKVYKTQHEAEKHYLKDGQFQQRLYKTENIPDDFFDNNSFFLTMIGNEMI